MHLGKPANLYFTRGIKIGGPSQADYVVTWRLISRAQSDHI